ncbi:unnamed protein product [Owenia fusiformis]|uniref:Uncharacterized protein n=1 Tax=Owenia fusiformis TaxID=6347 RepID=A0A8J1T6C9_OWEFU|nr:unnamed protein product [Owenia fusiformis]
MNFFGLLSFLLLTGECLVRCSHEEHLEKCLMLWPEISKEQPSPEPGLECPVFQEKSCCYKGATEPMLSDQQVQGITYYNHCPQKTELSAQCHQEFFDELCFFMCSPDTGPWITFATHEEPVRDRFIDVPICPEVCEKWWQACKQEYTCTDNWYLGFNMSTGRNHCHNIDDCKPYTEIFKTAKNFCESIWDFSFKVVDEGEPCMNFVYDLTKDDNNRRVAEMKAKELSELDKIKNVEL